MVFFVLASLYTAFSVCGLMLQYIWSSEQSLPARLKDELMIGCTSKRCAYATGFAISLCALAYLNKMQRQSSATPLEQIRQTAEPLSVPEPFKAAELPSIPSAQNGCELTR
eukprot:6015580-Amphidinium_carterae.1